MSTLISHESLIVSKEIFSGIISLHRYYCYYTTSVSRPFSRTTWVSRHQKGKPFWMMMGWQWHQLDHMQIICTSLQTDNHASVKALKAKVYTTVYRGYVNIIMPLRSSVSKLRLGWKKIRTKDMQQTFSSSCEAGVSVGERTNRRQSVSSTSTSTSCHRPSFFYRHNMWRYKCILLRPRQANWLLVKVLLDTK